MDLSTTALLALFIIALVPLLPTEVALLGLGVAAANAEVDLAPVILVAAVGCFLSDQFLYALARKRGVALLDRLRRRPSVDNGVRWISERAERNPRAILVISRWIPSGGTIGALLAGVLRWRRGPFMAASAVGVVLWSTYVTMLGYLGGQFVQQPGVSLLISLAVAATLAAAAGIAVRRGVKSV